MLVNAGLVYILLEAGHGITGLAISTALTMVGASLALILLSACMLYLARPLSELLDAYGNTFEVSGLSGREVLVFLLSGGALGLLGALLAVQRYFRQFRLDSANAGE